MTKSTKRLILCVLLDLVGYLSFLVPLFDFVWAPLSALIMTKIFQSKRGQYAALVSFIEEIFPFSDIIPTFTIMHFFEDYKRKKEQKN